MKNSKPNWQTLRLTDRIHPGVHVLFVGINPGVRSAETGHHFAGSSNRFWKLLYESKLVPEPITHLDDARLPEWGLGITNVIARPSPGSTTCVRQNILKAGGFSKPSCGSAEPQILAFVGVTLYRALDQRARRRGGRGDSSGLPAAHQSWRTNLRATRIPSGRNANFSYAEMLSAFKALRRAIERSGQCAAIGPPPRGRFIRRISGISSRKITPSSRNSWTNDTIDACCCTIPNSAP